MRTGLKILAGFVGLFLVMQLIPVGREHDNPPVLAEPDWDSPETRELAKRACFDCHSNETVWSWTSNIAPISWLVTYHVHNGRSHLHFSEWGVGERHQHVEEIEEMLRTGAMPLPMYLLLNPEAKLSDAERQALIDGLLATVGEDPVHDEEHDHDDHDHEDDHDHDHDEEHDH